MAKTKKGRAERCVRAKFKVQSIERTMSQRKRPDGTWGPGELHTVKMFPIYHNDDPDHENTAFWEATPSGSLELGMVNAEAVAHFEIGHEYYIDFIPVQ